MITYYTFETTSTKSWIGLILLLTSFLILSKVDAQNLEVIGHAKITEMDKQNSADSVLVRLPDGTLGIRDKSTLTKDLDDPTGNQDAATKAYVDLLENRLNLLQNTINAGGPIQDFDGNSYQTVKIGNQIWMSENLRTTTYNDGTPLTLEIDNANWSNLTTPAYCWYENQPDSLGKTYGALYNYYTVADTNSKNVCPVDWHVPDTTAWKDLVAILGGDIFLVGGYIKEVGLTHWEAPNDGATNESGFSGLPAGYRLPWGDYDQVEFLTNFWSSSSADPDLAWNRYLVTFNSHFDKSTEQRQFGFSVRCVKN